MLQNRDTSGMISSTSQSPHAEIQALLHFLLPTGHGCISSDPSGFLQKHVQLASTGATCTTNASLTQTLWDTQDSAAGWGLLHPAHALMPRAHSILHCLKEACPQCASESIAAGSWETQS